MSDIPKTYENFKPDWWDVSRATAEVVKLH